MTPDEIRAALTDSQAVALTLMFEGASEPVEGRVAIGSVIRNRVQHPKRFSATYRGVCVQRAQFSCWWLFGGETNYLRLMRAAGAVVAGQAPPFNDREADIFRECWHIAEGIMGGYILDNTGGATNYYAPAAMKPKGSVPKEAVGRPSLRIGSQIFYSAL